MFRIVVRLKLSAFVNYCIASPSGATGNLFALHNYLIDRGIFAVLVQYFDNILQDKPVQVFFKVYLIK